MAKRKKRWGTPIQRHSAMRFLFARQAGVCVHCGKDMRHPDEVRAEGNMDKPWAPSIDHIVPQADGGAKADRQNMALAHGGCNWRRARKPFPLERLALLTFKPVIHEGA